MHTHNTTEWLGWKGPLSSSFPNFHYPRLLQTPGKGRNIHISRWFCCGHTAPSLQSVWNQDLPSQTGIFPIGAHGKSLRNRWGCSVAGRCSIRKSMELIKHTKRVNTFLFSVCYSRCWHIWGFLPAVKRGGEVVWVHPALPRSSQLRKDENSPCVRDKKKQPPARSSSCVKRCPSSASILPAAPSQGTFQSRLSEGNLLLSGGQRLIQRSPIHPEGRDEGQEGSAEMEAPKVTWALPRFQHTAGLDSQSMAWKERKTLFLHWNLFWPNPTRCRIKPFPVCRVKGEKNPFLHWS